MKPSLLFHLTRSGWRFAAPPTLGFVMLVAAGALHGADLASRFYFNSDVGVSFLQNATVTSSSLIFDGGTMKFDPGVAFDVGFGYRITDQFAAEIETGLLFNSASLSGNSFDLYQASILGNLVYQIPTGSRFHPFIGAGVGASSMDLETGDFFSGGSGQDSGLAWQGFAGCRYEISPSWDVGLVYKYLGSSDRDFSGLDFHMKGIQVHRVAVVFRVNF